MSSLPGRRHARRLRASEAIAFVIVAVQLIGIVRLFFVDDRFFGWSPHDQRTDIVVSATWNGRPVGEREIAQRYGLSSIDWHGSGNALRVIETAERRTPEGQRWQVRIELSINGRPKQVRRIG